MAHEVTAVHERPVFFSNGEDLLFGIFTEPPGRPLGTAVVALSGGVHIPSANRNRLWVHLTRRLAASGRHAFRFDYKGTGESGGASEPYRRDRPRSQDLLGAIDWLGTQGLQRFVLVGTCFGSLTALLTAPGIAGVEGVVLLSPLVLESKSSAELASRTGVWSYLRSGVRPSVFRRLLDSSTRAAYVRIVRAKAQTMRARGTAASGGASRSLPASARVLRALGSLGRRQVPILIVFGSGDAHYEDFKRASDGRLGKLLTDSEHVEIAVLPGYLHGFPQLSVQKEVEELVSDWICRLPLATG